MNRLGDLIRRLLILGVGLAIFIWVPILLGSLFHMWWSWIPATIAMEYLDDA